MSLAGGKNILILRNVQDIQCIYKKNITLSSPGIISDGHFPMTHTTGQLIQAQCTCPFFSPFPERSLSNEVHSFVADRHLAALSQS